VPSGWVLIGAGFFSFLFHTLSSCFATSSFTSIVHLDDVFQDNAAETQVDCQSSSLAPHFPTENNHSYSQYAQITLSTLFYSAVPNSSCSSDSDWVTVAFFLFSFVHCFSQGIIHSFLFSIDSEFAGMVTKIVHTAEIPLQNMTYLEGSSNRYLLRMCDNIPIASSCMVIFQSGQNIGNESEAAVRPLCSILTSEMLTPQVGCLRVGFSEFVLY